MSSKWKCTKCRKMVAESDLKKHKCNPMEDLKTGDSQRDGAVQLAYLRGKQGEVENE